MHACGTLVFYLITESCLEGREREKTHTYTGVDVCTDKSPTGEHGKGSDEAGAVYKAAGISG